MLGISHVSTIVFRPQILRPEQQRRVSLSLETLRTSVKIAITLTYLLLWVPLGIIKLCFTREVLGQCFPSEVNGLFINRKVCALKDGEKLTTKPGSASGLDYVPFSIKISPNSMLSQLLAPSSTWYLIQQILNTIGFKKTHDLFELTLMIFDLDLQLAFALRWLICSTSST